MYKDRANWNRKKKMRSKWKGEYLEKEWYTSRQWKRTKAVISEEDWSQDLNLENKDLENKDLENKELKNKEIFVYNGNKWIKMRLSSKHFENPISICFYKT